MKKKSCLFWINRALFYIQLNLNHFLTVKNRNIFTFSPKEAQIMTPPPHISRFYESFIHFFGWISQFLNKITLNMHLKSQWMALKASEADASQNKNKYPETIRTQPHLLVVINILTTSHGGWGGRKHMREWKEKKTDGSISVWEFPFLLLSENKNS